MDYRYDIESYVDKAQGIVNVVVEINKGSRNKYEIDEVTGDHVTVVRSLHKDLFRDYKYQFNYGFIPRTLADDKDQLDAIVIDDEEIAPLTVIPCRVVGAVKTIDKGEGDDKILVVPTYSTKKSVYLPKIVKFLKNYKYPDNDTTEVGEVVEKDEALDLIDKAVDNYIIAAKGR